MQYRKNIQPASSIKEIIAIHTSINLKGFKNGASCLRLEFYKIDCLSFCIKRLLQHVAIQSISDTNTVAPENGNI